MEFAYATELSTSLIALMLLAPLLAGCLERGQPTMVNAGGDDDDAFCRANNCHGRLIGICRLPQGPRRPAQQRQLPRRPPPARSRRIHAEPSGNTLGGYFERRLFNASLRKFLKKVGITSQREIEKAVRDAVEAGRLKGNERRRPKWF